MYNFKPPSLPKLGRPAWVELVSKYQNPDQWRSLWQVVNTLVPLAGLWYLMYRSLAVGYWLTLLLAVPAAGMLVRVFIILHDCGHGSFFKSARANDALGTVCGILTFTPYFQWRHAHAIHHASSGDLDRRGVGDVLTLTVKEYLALPWWKQLGYRVYRNPVVMFGIAPLLLFLVGHRFTGRIGGKRERFNVRFTNLAILALALAISYLIGFKAYLLIQLPTFGIAASAGVWMFYVQHQFEDTYWREHPEWQYTDAALVGSSYYKLPKVLQWFTGNIGFHHIHHLSPKIPNYKLPQAYAENPYLRQVTVVTLWESLKTIPLKLWDEEQQKLISFTQLKFLRHKYGTKAAA